MVGSEKESSLQGRFIKKCQPNQERSSDRATQPMALQRLCLVFLLTLTQRLSHAFFIAPFERLWRSRIPSSKRTTGFTPSPCQLFAVSASQQQHESSKTPSVRNEESRVDEAKTAGLEEATNSASLSFPWDEAQRWALRDQVPKFTIQVVDETSNTVQRYVLWRNLVQSSPELAGYPLRFLADRLEDSTISKTIMPYLDSFHFETSGGLSGKVYGVSGVADGTRIETTPVGSVQETIPLSYVQTGAILYELGNPRPEEEVVSSAPIDPSLTSSIAQKVKTAEGAGQLLDSDLINLAGLSATVLAGAWAMETLSHHLTVNVFWV